MCLVKVIYITVNTLSSIKGVQKPFTIGQMSKILFQQVNTLLNIIINELLFYYI